MSKEVIRQIPLLKSKHKCPICGEIVSEKREYLVELYVLDMPKVRRLTRLNLFYCPNCNLPLTTDGMREQLEAYSEGMSIITFVPNKHADINEIINKTVRTYNVVTKGKTKPNFYKCKYYPGTGMLWRSSKTLVTAKNKIFKCPRCNGKLQFDYTTIPKSDEHLRVPGMLCKKCNILYIKNQKEVFNCLNRNKYAKGFTLDGKRIWTSQSTSQFEKLLEKLREEALDETFSATITIKYENGRAEKFNIVEDKKEADIKKNIYHYSDYIAKELLCAAFEKTRNRTGMLDGIKFSVIKVQSRNETKLIPEDILIKRGGGLYSSIKNKNYEIVDLLLYSPYKDEYEIVHATYYSVDFECYIDASIYRNFIHKYGNPGVELYFGNVRYDTDGHDFEDYNLESTLKLYGYSVSMQDRLTDKEREELLAEIMDLNILTQSKIIYLINMFIKTHPGDSYSHARSLWKHDLEFVTNYKVNPKRFMIGL